MQKLKTYICRAHVGVLVEAQDESEAEELAGMEMDIGDIDWEAEEAESVEPKFYYAKLLVTVGEYKTYTGYCLKAPDMETAERQAIKDWGAVDALNHNEVDAVCEESTTELISLLEVTVQEYTVLEQYV